MALTRINNNSLSSVTAAGLPEGSVLQVQSYTLSSTAGPFSAGSYQDTGLAVNITPTSASSKIYISYSLQVSSVTGQYNIFSQIKRGTTAIGIGDEASNRPTATSASSRLTDANSYQSTYGFYLDDNHNSTTQLTYSIQVMGQVSTPSFYVNRSVGDNDNTTSPRLASTITVMEIAGA